MACRGAGPVAAMTAPAGGAVTRAELAEIEAKRSRVTVEVVRSPRPGTRERLVDLLVELLDEHRHSGRR